MKVVEPAYGGCTTRAGKSDNLRTQVSNNFSFSFQSCLFKKEKEKQRFPFKTQPSLFDTL